MSPTGFFEVRIATHQRGWSEVDYRAIHRHMEAHGFQRVLQTTAQSANEVPGIYRLQNTKLPMEQVMAAVRSVLAPLGKGMAVRIMKVEEEEVFDLVLSPVSAIPIVTDTKPKRARSPGGAKAQSGYPAWKRPR
jgi:hypothetical protein